MLAMTMNVGWRSPSVSASKTYDVELAHVHPNTPTHDTENPPNTQRRKNEARTKNWALQAADRALVFFFNAYCFVKC